jgi:hypothetical protein
VLLADHRDVGETLGQTRDDQRFGLLVGDGDRALVLLGGDRQPRTEQRQDEPRRLLDDQGERLAHAGGGAAQRSSTAMSSRGSGPT